MSKVIVLRYMALTKKIAKHCCRCFTRSREFDIEGESISVQYEVDNEKQPLIYTSTHKSVWQVKSAINI